MTSKKRIALSALSALSALKSANSAKQKNDMTLLTLSIFLITTPRCASIKMLLLVPKYAPFLTFSKKVSKVSKVSMQIFIGQNLTSSIKVRVLGDFFFKFHFICTFFL